MRMRISIEVNDKLIETHEFDSNNVSNFWKFIKNVQKSLFKSFQDWIDLTK